MRLATLCLLTSLLLAAEALPGDEAAKSESQSYTRTRLQLAEMKLVPASEIRPDEWINYQDYDLPRMTGRDAGATPRAMLSAALRIRPSEPDWSAMLMLATQTAVYPSAREQPMDLVIVLDRSGSMNEARKMDYAHEGIRYLARMLQHGDRVGLIGFDNRVYVERPLTEWKDGDTLEAELRRLTPNGGTDLNLGLSTGMQMLLAAPAADGSQTLRRRQNFFMGVKASGLAAGRDSAPVPEAPQRAKRLLLITDGIPTSGETDPARIEAGLKPGFERGVRMSSIGVGLNYNDALLSRLCKIPGNNGRFLDRPEEIKKSMLEQFNAMLPVELDKPQASLVLPAGVRVANAYGTTFVQEGNAVIFNKLTSLGSGDHQIVCLQLRGSPEALQAVCGASVEYSAYSPAMKRQVQLSCGVEVLGPDDDAAMSKPAFADSRRGRLNDALRKAGAVALVADALRAASEAAANGHWELAEKQVKTAEAALDTFGADPKEPQIREIKALVALDRQVLNDLRKPTTGARRWELSGH